MLQGTQNNKHVATNTTSYQSQTALKNIQNLGYFEPEKGNASWVIGSTTPQEVSFGFKNHLLCKSFVLACLWSLRGDGAAKFSM